MFASARTGLCIVFVVAATGTSSAQPVDAERVRELAGLVGMLGPLQMTRDTCVRLYPSQAVVIRGLYEASSVPDYVKMVQYDVPSPPSSADRNQELDSLGMSDAEASQWCLDDFPSMLREFDEHFENRTEQMRETFDGISAAIANRPPAAAKPRPPPQDPRFVALFAQIVERSNRAYETGNWSVLADAYVPGTFDCWQSVPNALQFGFLSMPPLSPAATFKVSKFDGYGLGEPYAFIDESPAYLMEVSDEVSSPGGRCGLEKRQRWPRPHFFVVQRGNEFGLTHYCPTKEAVDAGKVVWRRPLSAAQAATNLTYLTEADWQAIAADVGRDRYSPRSQDRLMKQYDFGYEEADAAIDYVCNPANTR